MKARLALIHSLLSPQIVQIFHHDTTQFIEKKYSDNHALQICFMLSAKLALDQGTARRLWCASLPSTVDNTRVIFPCRLIWDVSAILQTGFIKLSLLWFDVMWSEVYLETLLVWEHAHFIYLPTHHLVRISASLRAVAGVAWRLPGHMRRQLGTGGLQAPHGAVPCVFALGSEREESSDEKIYFNGIVGVFFLFFCFLKKKKKVG